MRSKFGTHTTHQVPVRPELELGATKDGGFAINVDRDARSCGVEDTWLHRITSDLNETDADAGGFAGGFAESDVSLRVSAAET